jgi:uncharacterized protein YfaA (DUF2138 family)
VERKTRNRALIGLGALVATLGVVALTRAQFGGSVNALNIDLQHPDILVRSARLSDLPKDLAQSPLLRGVLSPEVVHYYEDHPTRLSVLGTLKRLAYDYQLTWADQVLSSSIAAPAELALWRDGKGRPEYFMLVLQKNLLTQVLDPLSKLTLNDEQLSIAGELPTHQGTATVYALKISQRNHWLLVGLKNKLIVLSDPGLLLQGNDKLSREASKVITAALEAGDTQASPLAAELGLGPLQSLKQQIVARADYLSMGYQHFFPGLDAVRVDEQRDGSWGVSAKVTPEALTTWKATAKPLWAAMPRGSALCVAMPVDWSLATPLLGAVAKPDTAAVLNALNPVSATCWNSAGGLYAPILAAQFKGTPGAQYDPALKALLADVTRKKAGKGSGAADGAAIAPTSEKALSAPAQGKLWRRTIPHELGAIKQAGVKANVVSVARNGSTVLASVDERAINQALNVASKTYPAMGDERGVPGTPVLSIDGAELARLLEAQTWQTLSPQTVPTFYRVAKQLLPARLQALKGMGRVQVSLPDGAVVGKREGSSDAGGSGWVALRVNTAR